ncbi:Tether containing UBX domain for GLUT4 [Mycena sanguinolenta]|uniref:Tether containing UBX domain for GLUT4 n=1 Tax=Mycena sanguinolenta TaxID=230812 RepID=A0A8H6YY47_9AGAR|nr:Tether containing UBX domain for GLUT4 [Mycena sanguinolenta]
MSESASAPTPEVGTSAPAPAEVPVSNSVNANESVTEQPSPAPTTPTPAATPSFKVYKPSSSSAPPPPPLPDDYFTPTAADLKQAQASLTARTQALNDAPLQLRAVREAAEKSKRDRWPNTTIRIRFTDRTQLEKVFPSTNKIRSVYAFVRDSLRDDVKPVKFVLYQPPKRDLKVSDLSVRDLTLSELYLAPSSVLLLRFEDSAHAEQALTLNGASLHSAVCHLLAGAILIPFLHVLNTTTLSAGSTMPAPLRPDILAQAIDLPAPPPVADASSSSSSTPSGSSSSELKASLEKKIPKWMKMGLKK